MIAEEASFARLMARAQTGDKLAYNVLLGEAAMWLERYFRKKVPPHQLDDLVQDVLLSLHRKRASYDPNRPFLPWLSAIARYRWVDHLRKVYKHEANLIQEGDASEDNEEDVVEARVSLERLFAMLPGKQAEAIALVKIEGRSIREVSQATGQSESLVKVNIHRGLRKLSAFVEKAE